MQSLIRHPENIRLYWIPVRALGVSDTFFLKLQHLYDELEAKRAADMIKDVEPILKSAA